MQALKTVLGAMIALGFVTVVICSSLQFDIASDYGQFSSPNYPENYPVNVTCWWTITVVSGSRVLLNFTDFQVEKNKKCLYDYLVIRESKRGWGAMTTRYCGHGTIQEYLSERNQIQVVFASDVLGKVGKGFIANWVAADGMGRPLVKTEPTEDDFGVNMKYVSRSYSEGLLSGTKLWGNTVITNRNKIMLKPTISLGRDELTESKLLQNHDKIGSKFKDHTEDLVSRNRRLVIILGSFIVLLSIFSVVTIILIGRRSEAMRSGFTSTKAHAARSSRSFWTTDQKTPRDSHPGFQIIDGDVIIVSTDGRVLGQPERRCIPSIHESERFSRATDFFMSPCKRRRIEGRTYDFAESHQHYLVVQSDEYGNDIGSVSDATDEYC